MTTTIEILAPAILLVIAGICKAVSDLLAGQHSKSIFPNDIWWIKGLSWKNKWRGGDPKNGERFPGSSTVFVWLTDGWHFFNMVQYTAMILAVVSYFPVYGFWYDALILKAIFTITFEVFYRWVFIDRQ